MKKISKNLHFSEFFSNVSHLFIGRITSLFFQFLSGILFARLLGPEQKGIITVALVIPGLLVSFADLGIRQATMFFMGKKKYTDQELISSVLFTTQFTSILGISIALIIYLITGFHTRYDWALMLIPLAIIPVTFLYTYSSGVLLAKLEIKKVAFLSILNDAGFMLIIFFLYIFNIKSVVLILTCKVLCALIPAISALNLLKKYGILMPSYQPKLIMELIKKGIIFAIALFLLDLNFSLDIILLNQFSTASEVGIYSIGVSIANILWMLPNALTTVNFSYSSNAQSEMEYAKKTVNILRFTLLFALVPLILLYFFSPIVIPWIYSTQFTKSASVVQAILPGVWAMLIYKILNSDLAGRGMPGAGIWVCFVALLVNIFLNYWWDPIWGAIGSAWASSVSYTLVAIIYSMVYCKLSHLRIAEIFIITKDDIKIIQNFFKRIAS
ncbi:MAG: oligosaccharide flippase family protein [Anaerolineae bacterium]|nr:oligosaccharide flippase family protein [Anaerolineae bacterium]